MVGDTLHTDILGGRAAGFKTALVTEYGVMQALDIPQCISDSGIRPALFCRQSSSVRWKFVLCHSYCALCHGYSCQ